MGFDEFFLYFAKINRFWFPFQNAFQYEAPNNFTNFRIKNPLLPRQIGQNYPIVMTGIVDDFIGLMFEFILIVVIAQQVTLRLHIASLLFK